MRTSHAAALIVLLCGGAATAHAADASVSDIVRADYLPPEERIASALAAQPDVRAAAARLRTAHADARALEIGAYELEATVIPQRRRTDGGGYDEWEAQLSRRIRLPGKARLDRDIGRHTIDAAELRLDDSEHQAARRLLALWMAWLRDAHTANESDEQTALLRRERDALARRVTLGDAAQRELDAMEAERAQADAQAIAARAQADASRRALAGRFPQIPLPERAPPLSEPAALPEDAERWRQRIVERSHEIGIAEEDALRQTRIAERTRADRMPDPSLGLRMMSDRGGAESALGVVLNVPIGGRYRRALSDKAEADAAAAAADAANVRQTIEQDAWDAAHAADSRLAQWRSQQRAVAAQTSAAARTRRAWELGETGLGEYLQAQRLHRQARLAETLARADALEAALLVLVDSHELWHPELAFDEADAAVHSR
ncbi:MAG: TolC family protein [Lysobacter sp.]|nr:TolC family protein [Lysobacter sp.]